MKKPWLSHPFYFPAQVAPIISPPQNTKSRSRKYFYCRNKKVYVGIANLPVSQETAAIKGMQLDLRKPEFAETFTALGLTTYMNELERLNNLYKQLMAERSAARSTKSIETDSKTLSQQTNSLYEGD